MTAFVWALEAHDGHDLILLTFAAAKIAGSVPIPVSGKGGARPGTVPGVIRHSSAR
jgi:hypothetical protein